MSSNTLGTVLQIGGIVASFIPGIGWMLRAGIILATSVGSALLKRRGLAEQQQGALVNITSNEAALPVVYGRAKLGLKLVDVRVDEASEDNKDLALVGAFCVASEDGGGIEEIEDIWFDERHAIDSPDFSSGAAVSTGLQASWIKDGSPHVHYELHAGTDAQAVTAELDSTFGEWTSTARGRGIAYAVLWLFYDRDIFASGIPNVTALVKGQKLYDPREDDWAWSDNPALCVLDYLTSKRYGMGALYSERDGGSRSEIDEQSFIDAANYCDETVSIPGGTQKRFTCNGWIDTGRDHGSSLFSLLSSCRGELLYEGGKFRLSIRAASTPTTFELNPSNIIGNWEWFRGGLQQAPNRVAAAFIDASQDRKPNDVLWPEAGQSNDFLTNDGDFENVLQVDLPFTDDYYRAQQIAMVALREARNDLGVALTAKEEALKLHAGDVVPVTHPIPGWAAKEFWVVAMGINPDATVRLILREYDADAYSLDAQDTRDTLPGTTHPNPFTIAAPTGLTLTSSAATAVDTQDGQKVPAILVEWTPPADPFLAGYLLRYREDGATDWLVAPAPNKGDVQALIFPVTIGTTYDVELFAENTLGVRSAPANGQILVASAPGDAALGVSVSLNIDGSGVGHATVTVGLGINSFRILALVGTRPTAAQILAAGTLHGSVDRVTVVAGVGRADVGQELHVGVIGYSEEDGTGSSSETAYGVAYASGTVQARPLNIAPTFSLIPRRAGSTGFPVAVLDSDPDGTMLPHGDSPDGPRVLFTRVDAEGSEEDFTPVTSGPKPEYFPSAVSLPSRWSAQARYRASDDEMKLLELGELLIESNPHAELGAPWPFWRFTGLVSIIFYHDDHTVDLKYLISRSGAFPNDSTTRQNVIDTGTLVTPAGAGANGSHIHHTAEPQPQLGGSVYIAAVARRADGTWGDLVVTSRVREAFDAGLVVSGTAEEERSPDIFDEATGEVISTVIHRAGSPRASIMGVGMQAVRVRASIVSGPLEEDIDHADTVALGPTILAAPSLWIESREIVDQVFTIAPSVTTPVDGGVSVFSTRFPTRAAERLSVFLLFNQIVLAGPHERLFVRFWPMGSPDGLEDPGPSVGLVIYGPDLTLSVPITEWIEQTARPAESGANTVAEFYLGDRGLAPLNYVRMVLQVLPTNFFEADNIILQVVYRDAAGSQVGNAFVSPAVDLASTEIPLDDRRILTVEAHQIPATAARAQVFLLLDTPDVGEFTDLLFGSFQTYLREAPSPTGQATIAPPPTTFQEVVTQAVPAAAAIAYDEASAQGVSRDETGAPTVAAHVMDETNTVPIIDVVARRVTGPTLFATRTVDQEDEDLDISLGSPGTAGTPLPPLPGVWYPGYAAKGLDTLADGNMIDARRAIWAPWRHSVPVRVAEISFRTGPDTNDPGNPDLQLIIAEMNAALTEPETIVFASAVFDYDVNTLFTVEDIDFDPEPGRWYADGVEVIGGTLDASNFMTIKIWDDPEATHKVMPVATSGGDFATSSGFTTQTEPVAGYTPGTTPQAWPGSVISYNGRHFWTELALEAVP